MGRNSRPSKGLRRRSWLFEYSFESRAGRGLFLPRLDSVSSGRGARLPQGVGVPFHLRMLDPASGRELWSRTFNGLPPIPFADPPGERLVLRWHQKALERGRPPSTTEQLGTRRGRQSSPTRTRSSKLWMPEQGNPWAVCWCRVALVLRISTGSFQWAKRLFFPETPCRFMSIQCRTAS
jgi:hypothetical protein